MFLAGLFVGACLPVLAATDATLVGTVLDPNGKPLPGTTVVLRNQDLAFHEQGTITNAQGEFRFSLVPPGSRYELTFSLPTFATVVFSDLSLESGRTFVQNAVLRPATDLKETVRVEGKSDTIDTEKVTASTTFSATFIAELPIMGRDYQDILILAPGVTDVNGTGNPNIHGARDTDVVTLVDGVSTTDPLTGLYGQSLNIESIQELEVITSAASAQYSRAQGGFANIMTKSGGNEFQGTFKLFLRSDRLDGDGAGVENPELRGGLKDQVKFTEAHFSDIKPFLSVSGPIVRDKVWFYFAGEYIHEETPVNALSQIFIAPTYGHREFLKFSWQAHPSHRLSLSVINDYERKENDGVGSQYLLNSGYYRTRGGPTLTLKGSSVFTPDTMLESSLAWFDNSFHRLPTTNPDTNGNGIFFTDDRPDLGGNQDGILDASERDPGEDWDRDGFFDMYEDLNHNSFKDAGEDQDRDGVARGFSSHCEGYDHEDLNCNGELDREEDTNMNGRLDPSEDVGIACDQNRGYCPSGFLPGTRGNGRFDTEDRNGNQQLDIMGDSGYVGAPFWIDANDDGWPDPGEYRMPLQGDANLQTSVDNRTYGPGRFEFEDDRKRLSWVEDFSLYVGDVAGSHDLKMGSVYEHEGYDSDTLQRPKIFSPSRAPANQPGGTIGSPGAGSSATRTNRVSTILGVPFQVNNTATGDNLGLYLQDTWKPVPNLTLGLGVRYDFERLDSFGYTHFDPVREGSEFRALLDASGVDSNIYDNVANPGLCLDPLYSCQGSPGRVAALQSQLRKRSFSRMTRHNLDVDVLSTFLSGVTGGHSDLDEALGYPVQTRAPESFEITNSNLAPRLSLSWDPWSDGKTMVFGSWGRYYDKLFLGSVVLEQGPDTVNRMYLWDYDGVDDNRLPDNGIGLPVFQSPLSAFQVDRNLSTPHADEWTAGFRRELAPEVLVSLRYVDRKYHDQLQDVDLNHHTDIEPSTGKFADRLGDTECQAGVCSNNADGAPDLYINNIYFNRVYRLGNFNEQEYQGYELEFVRRLKRKWQMEASYTFSKSKGDAESFLAEQGNDPSLTEFEAGFLDYDQRHVVKFNAIAFLPGDWRLGGTATWSSGLPYSNVIHYDDSDNVGYAQSRLVYGYLGKNGFGYVQEDRNSHRNPSAYLFNARVTKSFVVGKASASAFFEVYNLLNSDNLRIHSIENIPARLVFFSARDNTGIIIPPKVIVDGERDFGRRYQIGFQIDF
ncbi:MAG TPA: TonB-dependent receptor [Candidatus Polarisedimenticolia bacterium]|nr:TonB-dependent receptor [Candidatus Polarisedimenticolia bacterium]